MSLSSETPEDAPGPLSDLRVSYEAGTLDERQLKATPLAQFRSWLADAVSASVHEPNAMVLTTVAASGQPSARTVLLKDVDARGFVFFTNLESRKSLELRENAATSCVFPWFAMHRQVVVLGRAEPIGRDEVGTYFASRPHGSQLGAWSSPQSSVIADRGEMEARFAELEHQYPEGSEVPVPDFWGGWLVRPESVEFWQGRRSRLHDRLRFCAITDAGADLSDEAAWRVERLAP